MPHKLIIFKEDQDIAQQYKNGLMAILNDYKDQFSKKAIIGTNEIDKLNGINEIAWDLNYFPHLWSKTNRRGATKIELNFTDSRILGKKQSLYDTIRNLLIKKRSEAILSKDDQALIDTVIQKLETYQNEANLAYMSRLRKKTAQTLFETLEHIENTLNSELKQHNDENTTPPKKFIKLKTDVSELKEDLHFLFISQEINNDFSTFTNTDQMFKWSKLVNDLRNELLTLEKNYRKEYNQHISVQFNSLAHQLSIITKRELDPIYTKPRALTTGEKARQILKGITTSIGAVCAIGATIAAFIPGGQPAALILGVISIVALFPMLDSIYEVGKNMYYGRSPTKGQTIELGIAIPLLAGLMFGAHALAPLVSAIAGSGAAITQTVTKVGVFIGSTFMNFFGSTLNSLGAIGNWLTFKKANEPKDASKVKVLPLNAGLNTLLNEEKELATKAKIILQKESVIEASKNHTLGYLFLSKKQQNGKAEVDNSIEKLESEEIRVDASSQPDNVEITFLPSTAHLIHSWKIGMFVDYPYLSKIKEAVQDYKKLNSNCPIEERLRTLNKINANIDKCKKKWGNVPSENKTKISHLQDWVNQEKQMLDEVKTDKIYLVQKPEK